MAIQILSILGILILAYGCISEYRRRIQLQKCIDYLRDPNKLTNCPKQ